MSGWTPECEERLLDQLSKSFFEAATKTVFKVGSPEAFACFLGNLEEQRGFAPEWLLRVLSAAPEGLDEAKKWRARTQIGMVNGRDLTFLNRLPQLHTLRISRPHDERSFPEGLEHALSLPRCRHLEIYRAQLEAHSLAPLVGSAIESLVLSHLPGKSIPDLSGAAIKTLKVISSATLESFGGGLGCLERLWISRCPLLKLNQLEDATSLRALELQADLDIEDLSWLPRMLQKGAPLEKLIVLGAEKTKRLGETFSFDSLLEVEMEGLGFTGAARIGAGLERLNLSSNALRRLDLSQAKGLRELYLRDSIHLEALEGLGELSNLEVLDLRGCASLKSIDGLEKTTVRIVGLRGTPFSPGALPAPLKSRASWARVPLWQAHLDATPPKDQR